MRGTRGGGKLRRGKNENMK